MKLIISSRIIEELQEIAREEAPSEICGLLFGRNGHVSQAQRTRNVAENPERHFEIDPAALIAAERSMRDSGADIIGYFHSHPGGNIEPSVTDAEMAFPDDRIWVILNGEQVAAWQATASGEIFNRFNPVKLDCPLD
ncbi:M67 family metallopeptidase [Parasphingorhabdus sp.]|uniref:M67 family metallopeptidase n=1 Tax=Parasphingorhabdus sp. TaxID=2709688 RepID=UPI003264BBDC